MFMLFFCGGDGVVVVVVVVVVDVVVVVVVVLVLVLALVVVPVVRVVFPLPAHLLFLESNCFPPFSLREMRK